VERAEGDALGRPTRLTDPKGNVTYVVYNDAAHEVRTYAGWQAASNLPTGPTSVVREDRGRSYVETLTMTAPPAVSGGRPTGGEAVAAVQTLSRQYVSPGGQVTRQDDYFNLAGLTYSTTPYLGAANVHYYTTTLNYDARGRLNRVLSP